MDQLTSYDDDIYAWAFEQAAALRRLAATRPGLGNELDIENIAEEIEDLGHSELDRAESVLGLILLHLLKIASAPEARAARHWAAETRVFHQSFTRRLSRSIINKIDVDEAWLTTIERAAAQLELEGDEIVGGLPKTAPLSLDALARRPFDLEDAIAAIRQSAAPVQSSS